MCTKKEQILLLTTLETSNCLKENNNNLFFNYLLNVRESQFQPDIKNRVNDKTKLFLCNIDAFFRSLIKIT